MASNRAMPTSTPWRGRTGTDSYRPKTPERPLSGDIEQLSPEPTISPHLPSTKAQKRPAREQPLVGLGLSGPSSLSERHLTTHPDHIYIDKDGGAHLRSKIRSNSDTSKATDHRTREGRIKETRSSRSGSRYSKAKHHIRSGSTIDDLANIAIATSPTFEVGSPSFAHTSGSSRTDIARPATSYVSPFNIESPHHERSAKRVRSEKLHAMEWSPRDARPRTSHAIQPHSTMEDAELLLGLRNGYSFSTNTSPVFAPVATLHHAAVSELIRLPSFENDLLPPDQDAELHDSTARQDETMSENNVEEVKQEEAVSDTAAPKTSHQSTEAIFLGNDEPKELPAAHTLEKAEVGALPAKVTGIDAEPLVENRTAVVPKKPRKVKPEIQAEVCAACKKLQRDSNGDGITTQWICCDFCSNWFHLACGGFKDKAETRAVDKFVCKECEPQHGQTTFVRKSSRVRTAIDYAGLNQGVIKSAEESSLHHYIRPIKDGTIRYHKDDFARVRPELLTAEFWENMDNMKRPFVVPACWNPRFGLPEHTESYHADGFHAEPVLDASSIAFDSHGVKSISLPTSKDAQKDTEPEQNLSDLVLDCDQDYLDMVMPRNLTVRRVAELYGPDQPVPVIEVKSQETKGQWTLNEWANYYEQPGEKIIRNVISLEVSHSPIGKLIRRPKAVRDIDLEDHVWDNETRTTSNKRPVQFYCLMSVADSYTDFHIDFGGSSVYYHILKGIKTFFFIPPEDKYLKEYEKWCNSDTQNETWLGDMCNGNVTRVDLHPGDTAFIPAGWIHSVWTPEDSLVIGGNFLTRVDYELQLKVANIEKVTRVPQKFRYPFFQKVMWYTLLKYLEEDPLPEEILRDFHADEDYRYLRANPVWHEFGDLTNDAEPGEPHYNARSYPKSEVTGLPALRDYLYRTACIHADIPVPDINKKQIDAVKASIPKGHGDPMRLIKNFAVWCAWKIGNESVPKWVHDHGDGLTSEIQEREKAKEESFRVPPERVSARNASKTKATSPAVEVIATPVKSVTNIDYSDGASTKSRSGSRGGSLRVACEACRKRRIKCRHKEGDENAANSSPPEIRPRTYSNVSVDIPKLASTSPVNSAFEQTPTTNCPVSDFNTTSDLAQAALATLDSQGSDPAQAVTQILGSGSSKKGRSKACEECRKSKRRCVHDEYGRIDPTKAAEPSKPRGTTGNKRHARMSEELPTKRFKSELEYDPSFSDVANHSDYDGIIDPALMGEGISMDVIHAPTESIVMQDDSLFGLEFEPPNQQLEIGSISDSAERTGLQTIASGDDLIDPMLLNDGLLTSAYDDSKIGGIPGPGVIPAHIRRSPEIDNSYSPITIDGNVADSTEKVETHPVSANKHSAIVCHPNQTQSKEQHRSDTTRSPIPINNNIDGNNHRTSSSSEATLDTTVKSRRSSNTSGATHQVNSSSSHHKTNSDIAGPSASRATSVGSDVGADERFARELQAAENGLRRRASMRA